MVSVKINGAETGIGGNGLSRISEIIELIKASIDPSHMITGILLNGRELEEQDWTASVTKYGTCILEVETGTPDDYVSDRLGQAGEIVRSCYYQFRDARKKFQGGNMLDGNKRLIEAVNTSKAFFEWYGTLMELVPASKRPSYDITVPVQEITEICKRICQQQLYQSWWALGETIEKELEPKLDKLEDFCSKLLQLN